MNQDLSVKLTGTFTTPELPLLGPGTYNDAPDKQLIPYLNELRSDFNTLLNDVIRKHIDALVPYRPGQVLNVDLSPLGRRRPYYKGATRFLIHGIEPFFWSDSYSGAYKRLWVNIYGFYLQADGTLFLPEMLPCGAPSNLSPADIPLERLSMNTGGTIPTILGLSADQHHERHLLDEAIAKQEAKAAHKS